MQELQINLQYCFGIKELSHKFDFSNGRTFVIYAPNGVMKSSFAKTAKTLFEGKKKPCDQIDTSLEAKYDFLVEDEVLDPQKFCVIQPYNEESLNSEGNILTLLANKQQRERYLAIYKEIEGKKKSALSGLKKISGSSNFEKEILETFSDLKKKNLYEVLEEIINSIITSKEDFNFVYNDVFDAKGNVKKFLEKNSETLEEYFQQYENLIQNSEFFSASGDATFGTTEAKSLNKSLEGGEYFAVGYGLSLGAGKLIADQDILEKTIDEEISNIFADPDLKKTFDKLDKALDGNGELRKFKKVINKSPELLTRLTDYEGFRKVVWYSFLKKVQTGIQELVECYVAKKEELKELVDEANKNEGAWKDAIEEFNNRFIDMPFEMHIKNRPDAVLQNETPTLGFSFMGQAVDRKVMVEEILSQGEKRAFYLLNIIFEIKIRAMSDEETLFIIDDIADSFDYKNKYAIVEYLNDLTQEEKFHCIILTHNFDFYRTICSRLNINRKNKLHASKENEKILLDQEHYQSDKGPFETWKNCMSARSYHQNTYSSEDALKHIIALIPFVRNLIDYGHDKKVNTFNGIEKDFILLTSLLHKKPDTESINFGHLKEIYEQYLGKCNFDQSIKDNETVFHKIKKVADNIIETDFNLENKIVLAIAIRLEADEYMFSKVTSAISEGENQTRKFFESYKRQFSNDKNHTEAISCLEKVNIMTPENIHLNSFMYEPILDMGTDELKNLYDKIKNLNQKDF